MNREFIVPAGVAPPPDPYTHAVRAGDTLYIAGQVARDEYSEVIGAGDARRQAEQCWKNIEFILRAAGGQLADIVKVTIFLKDTRYAAAERDVREGLFQEGRYPIATQVQVVNLAHPDFLMEIDAIAVLG